MSKDHNRKKELGQTLEEMPKGAWRRMKQATCQKCGSTLMYLISFLRLWNLSFDPFDDTKLTHIPQYHFSSVWCCRACDAMYEFYSGDHRFEIRDITERHVKA